MALQKINSLGTAMLAKAMGYSSHSLVKSLGKICHFPASVNGTIDKIQFPFVHDAIANAQCERTLMKTLLINPILSPYIKFYKQLLKTYYRHF